jgi:hypothetical protein
MSDFWSFRTMITPVIIEIIFWIGVIVCLIGGGIMIFSGFSGYHTGQAQTLWTGLGVFFLGPLVVRVYCEILIVFFRINETLTEIKHAVEQTAPPLDRPEGT